MSEQDALRVALGKEMLARASADPRQEFGSFFLSRLLGFAVAYEGERCMVELRRHPDAVQPAGDAAWRHSRHRHGCLHGPPSAPRRRRGRHARNESAVPRARDVRDWSAAREASCARAGACRSCSRMPSAAMANWPPTRPPPGGRCKPGRHLPADVYSAALAVPMVPADRRASISEAANPQSRRIGLAVGSARSRRSADLGRRALKSAVRAPAARRRRAR